MTFQEQLIYYRKKKGLSQEQLGNQIGVSRQTVSKWELGLTTPEMDKLIQMSRLFDVSIDELVGNQRGSEATGREKKQDVVEVHFYKWHYEYKSKTTIFGIPLVHIHLGHGFYKARGIIAVGTIAKGILSAGVVSMGILSLGAISFGLLSVGAFALGLLLAVGAISIGTVAIGGLALGILAIGGCALGVYSIGGAAIASRIAAGGYANAAIAIGDQTNGQTVFDIHQNIPADAIKNAILEKFPRTWKLILDLFRAVV